MFADLNLSAETLQSLIDMGFTSPSPIQEQAIPFLLEGKDMIGQAQTGTGKTAAFAVPAVELIDVEKRGVQTLVMCPTRELAIQVAEEFKKIGKFKKGFRTVAVYGGSSIDKQIQALRQGVQVVIGTPGRIMDHIDRGTLKLDSIEMVILDEADEMLNMGFIDDIESILSNTPEERQTVFFSATMPKPIMDLTRRFQKNPEIIKVAAKELTVSNIEQFYFEVRHTARVEAMSRIIAMHGLKLMLVFCNQKRVVDELVEELQVRGMMAEGIHGDLRQQQRSNVLAKFKQGVVNILVATDVAARGIDVDNVDAVFNYDIPLDDESYVHRIGRTGRAGKNGKSFTFLTGRKDALRLKDIERYTKSLVTKGQVPSGAEIEAFRRNQFVEKITNLVNSDQFKEFLPLAEQILETGISPLNIIASLSKLHLGTLVSKAGSDDNFSVETRGSRDGSERGSRERNDRGSADRGGRSSDRFERSRSSSGDRFERGNDRFESNRGGFDRGGDRGRNSGSRFERSGDRPERTPRVFDTPAGDMQRIAINIGRNQRVRPGDIVGALAGESGINGKNIGNIEIKDSTTFVYVPKTDARKVLDAMSGNTIKGFNVMLELAD